MSLEVMKLVRNADLREPNGERFRAGKTLVLYMYADHAHDDGTEARPSIATVARETKLSYDQALAWVHSLRDDDVLIVERPPMGNAQRFIP